MNDVVRSAESSSGQRYPDGVSPPVETLAVTKSLLTAYHAQVSESRHRRRLEEARIQDQARSLALGQLGPDEVALKRLDQARRRLLEQRLEESEAAAGLRPWRPDLGGGVIGQAGLTVAVPPYDFDWVSGAPHAIEEADRTSGSYELAVHSFGDDVRRSAAGVGFWFYSGRDNHLHRFSALVDYFANWWDSADLFYSAANYGRTRLWVYGVSEQAWVAQSDQGPSWSDEVSWFASHGTGPEGESGRIKDQTYFNARPDSWYQCWIWSSANVDGESGLILGFGAAFTHLKISAPYAVLDSRPVVVAA